MQTKDSDKGEARVRRQLWLELAIVFALSLGASAVYSIVRLFALLTAPSGIGGSTTTINGSYSEREWLDLTYQLLGIGFGLAPVALALYLLWVRGVAIKPLLGLESKKWRTDVLRGLLVAAAIGIPGIALYLGARATGLASKVIANDLQQYWWTIPVLILAALKAALLEEVLVLGYLTDSLKRLDVRPRVSLAITSVLRGSYHLYQGIGGFVGNLLMGLVFGKLFQRWGRLSPLIAAHFVMDVTVFVGYSAVAHLLI